MTDHYRELLTNLRCDINLIRDSSFSSVRDAATRMLAVIDIELSVSPAEPANVSNGASPDISGIPSALLLREVAKRMRSIRHVRKLCSQCKNRPVRARNLCMHCYKKAYRRGGIKNASR